MRIYEARNQREEPGRDRRVGERLQGAGRQDATSHPRAPGQQRGVRLPYPRQPRAPATNGLPPSCVPAQERTSCGPPRRRLDALPGVEIPESRWFGASSVPRWMRSNRCPPRIRIGSSSSDRSGSSTCSTAPRVGHAVRHERRSRSHDRIRDGPGLARGPLVAPATASAARGRR